MGDTVFINDRSAFDASSSGKSLAAFPDLCLSPPPPPTGPVPVPYPNNALVSDITGCATSVMFCGNPAAHANSYISKSTGDEPADPKSGGQGNVVTHVVTGKAYFASHSMDVFIEGVEAVRHLDLTTHNHASPGGGTPPCPVLAKKSFKESGEADCGKQCKVVAYDKGCPKPKTPHHIIPKHCFKELKNVEGMAIPRPGWEKYNPDKAPCVCVTGAGKHTKSTGKSPRLLEHGRIHKRFDLAEAVAGLKLNAGGEEGGAWKFSEARDAGVKSVNEGTGGKCDEECLAAVVDDHHLRGSKKDPELRAHCPKSGKLRERAMKSVKEVESFD
jgi:hypothetical protein